MGMEWISHRLINGVILHNLDLESLINKMCHLSRSIADITLHVPKQQPSHLHRH